LDIQHMKTVKQLNATDMTKTTKLTMRLVTVYIQSINARRITTKNINETFCHVHFKKIAIVIITNRMQTNKQEMTKMYIMQKILNNHST